METIIVDKEDLDNIKKACNEIVQGNLVIFPTETVYGIGANAYSDDAVKKIFLVKGRPSDNPLIVHVGTKKMIEHIAKISCDAEKKIIDHLMPGPITLILKNKKICQSACAGLDTVGVRIPDHETALYFLQQTGLPIAAPSANISGKPSATTAIMCKKYFDGEIKYIIDGEGSRFGIESTVVRVEGDQIHILRPGFITKEDIEILLPTYNVFYSEKEKIRSPGTRYKHYKPNAEITLIDDHFQKTFSKQVKLGKKIGIMATKERIETRGKNNNIETTILIWGSRENPAECAYNLFSLYHQIDLEQIDFCFVEDISMLGGIGYAIMNRVKRSLE